MITIGYCTKKVDPEFRDYIEKSSGDLTKWAQQGVLLLNSVLTVSEKSPNSHAGMGWEIFTDTIIEKLSNEKKGIVFVLWGAYAQKKSALIDEQKHHILQAPHPSPLSSHRGFFGCNHFRETKLL